MGLQEKLCLYFIAGAGCPKAQIPACLFQAREVRDIAMLWTKNVRGQLSTPVRPKPYMRECGEGPQAKGGGAAAQQRDSTKPLVKSPVLGLPGKGLATPSMTGLWSWRSGILTNVWKPLSASLMSFKIVLFREYVWRGCFKGPCILTFIDWPLCAEGAKCLVSIISFNPYDALL